MDQLKALKDDDTDWCSEVESTVEGLESEYEITVCASVGIARRGSTSVTTTLDSFRKAVLTPYVDKLIENIRSRFSDEGVAVVIAMSVFNPANIPQADDPTFCTYGKEEIKQLAAFYGEEAKIEFQGESFQFPPVMMGMYFFLSGLYLEERYFMKKKLSCLLRSSPRVLLSSRYSKEFKRLTHMVEFSLNVQVD